MEGYKPGRARIMACRQWASPSEGPEVRAIRTDVGGHERRPMRRKLADNFKRVRERMHAACARSGRQFEDVRLVAVTKTIEIDVIRASIEAGLRDLGESRVQELVKRAGMIQEHLSRRRKLDPAAVPRDPRWHVVGHLQRNKVRMALPWIEVVHSLDSTRLADEISQEAQRMGRSLKVLLQVNVSNERSKFGVAVGAASHLAAHVANMAGLEVVGLMTMAPRVEDPESARPHFRRLREVFEDVQAEGSVGPEFSELSMGMSDDFEVAIEEGATIIRVGRGLFDGVVG